MRRTFSGPRYFPPRQLLPYLSHALRIAAICSGVTGRVGRCVTSGLCNLRAGFSSIHLHSCANRKNARRYSSFFKAARFSFGHDAEPSEHRQIELTEKAQAVGPGEGFHDSSLYLKSVGRRSPCIGQILLPCLAYRAGLRLGGSVELLS
jgi:hypothetical protein